VGALLVTVNFKEYTDEDVIDLIEKIKSGDAQCDLNDLKNLLAEVTNRQLGAEHTNSVNSLIHEKVAVKTEAKQGKAEQNKKGEKEVESFPVLNFLSGLLKVMAWLGLILCIALGCAIGYIYFSDEIMFAAAAVLAGIVVGTVLLLFFYAVAENIQVKLEIEKHLRQR